MLKRLAPLVVLLGLMFAVPPAPARAEVPETVSAQVQTVQYYGYGYRRPYYRRPFYRPYRPFYRPSPRFYRPRFYRPRPYYGRRFYR